MSITREIRYKGKTIKITVARNEQGAYVGTYGIEETDPFIRGVAADSSTENGALTNAERRAKEALDQQQV